MSGLDIELEQSENENPARKKIALRLRDVTSYTSFFSLYRWSSRSESGDMCLILAGCWNSLQSLGHSAWHWARQCTDTRAFILLHSLQFFFLGFRQWRARADRVVTLNMNIQLPLFWSTWNWARDQDSAIWAGRAHGRDDNNSLGTKATERARPLFSFDCLKYLKNDSHTERFLTLTA